MITPLSLPLAALPLYDLDMPTCSRIGVPYPCRARAEGVANSAAQRLFAADTGEYLGEVAGGDLDDATRIEGGAS